MIQDLHSHTYYSNCGKDRPEDMVEAVISGGIELLGITDHQYGVGYGRNPRRYFDHMGLIKEKYADRIKILRGIEICTYIRPEAVVPRDYDASVFDYCLIEHLDIKGSTVTEGDLFKFAKRFCCTVGVAHTDLFSFIEREGYDALDYFKRMADAGIFWEMNVNYDSIHGYNEHEYVKRFFDNEKQQEIIRESGVLVSVGFDGHNCAEYRAQRVIDANKKLDALGIKKPFDE